MNKYGSSLRSFRARNCWEGALPAIPADLTLTTGSIVPQLLWQRDTILNRHTNMVVKSVGIFSNFADGIVFKEQDERLDVILQAIAYSLSTRGGIVAGALTGTITTGIGNKTLTGVGTQFLTELAVGDIVIINNRYYRIASILNDLSADATDYAKITQVGQTGVAIIPDLTTLQSYAMENISELNTMFDADHFFTPVTVATGTTNDVIIIATLNTGTVFGIGLHATDFLTKSIDTAFATDLIHFDVVANVEFTRQ